MARFDRATGRYVYLTIDAVVYRVYFEEHGAGVRLLLQHTAGGDGRQWRHVLEDAALARQFRMIAYDLPYHGKSVPPTGIEWWRREYRLTKDFLMQVPVTLALELGRAPAAGRHSRQDPLHEAIPPERPLRHRRVDPPGQDGIGADSVAPELDSKQGVEGKAPAFFILAAGIGPNSP